MKNHSAIRKQFNRFKGQTVDQTKAAFNKNITGKRTPHFDDQLVALMQKLVKNGAKVPNLKGAMTKAKMGVEQQKAVFDLFNVFVVTQKTAVVS